MRISKTAKRTPQAPANAPKADAKPAFVLAAISPLTAAQVAKGFASAIGKVEGAQTTFMRDCVTTASLIGCALTAAQYDRQIAPSMREAFKAKARGKSGLSETTLASYRSRLKTFCLAFCSGLEGMTPLAGETMPVFLARVAEPLSKAVLLNGERVWSAEQGKAGRAAGTKVKGKGTGGGNTLTAHTSGEGGLDIAPAKAAALILTKGNEARAQRLVIVMASYGEDFDKWCASILTEKDKAELQSTAKPRVVG